MEDLTQLALKLFEIEKKHLLEEKQEYCCAVVIVITAEGRYYEDVQFNDEAEMDAAYGAVVERRLPAIPSLATAKFELSGVFPRRRMRSLGQLWSASTVDSSPSTMESPNATIKRWDGRAGTSMALTNIEFKHSFPPAILSS